MMPQTTLMPDTSDETGGLSGSDGTTNIGGGISTNTDANTVASSGPGSTVANDPSPFSADAEDDNAESTSGPTTTGAGTTTGDDEGQSSSTTNTDANAADAGLSALTLAIAIGVPAAVCLLAAGAVVWHRKQRDKPVPQGAALRSAGTTTTDIPLPADGLQMEVQLKISVDAGAVGTVGVYVLQSKDAGETTLIGHDAGAEELFVNWTRSSKLPAAPAGGGLAPGSVTQGYGIRGTERAPLPEAVVEGKLQLSVYLGHSILTIFAYDVAVITSRVYTSSASSAGVGVFFNE